MDEVKSFEIDQQQEGNIENKIITNHYHSPNGWNGKTFVNCVFRGNFHIRSSASSMNLVFHNCIFEGTVRGLAGDGGRISFSACKLKAFICEADFNEIYIDSFQQKQTYISSLIFRECKIDHLTIEESIINTFISHKSQFPILVMGNVKIRDHLNSNYCFYGDWSFHSSPSIKLLKIDAPLKKSKISLSNFESTEYLKLRGDFREINLDLKDNIFLKLELSYFQNVKSKIEFENVTVKNAFILNYSDLRDSRFFDCNFENSTLHYWYSYVKDIITVRNQWFNKIVAYDPFSRIDSSLNKHQIIEYLRQMKINSIDQKKFRESLEFYSEEMEMLYEANKFWCKPEKLFFAKDTAKWKKWIDKLVIFLINPIRDLIDVFFVVPFSSKRKNWSDGILMYLNKYSNRFGRYWIRPALLYFTFSYLLFAWIGNYRVLFTKFRMDVLKDPLFFRFLNPIHKISISELLQHSNSFYSFLELFTLIVQGYLIYQVIRSFRKFSFKIF